MKIGVKRDMVYTLSGDMGGIPLSKSEFYEMDRVASYAMKKGYHIYHIVTPNNLNVSLLTIYRHLHKVSRLKCWLQKPLSTLFHGTSQGYISFIHTVDLTLRVYLVKR